MKSVGDSRKLTGLGTSFSAGYCEDLGLDWKTTLEAALGDLGIRRLRLMSHWSRMESVRGHYQWRELDEQIAMATKYGAVVSLCLGIRQPRYPEFHQPGWARELGACPERNEALLDFIRAVVMRYKGSKTIVSWQLENEALNRSFGEVDDFDRLRLRREFDLVKTLDSSRPIIMTTSNTWGIPIRRPIPDIVGFSLYRIQHKAGGYKLSAVPYWLFSLRSLLVRILHARPSIIHEMQAEPWGPSGTQELSLDEQNKSFDAMRLRTTLQYARKTGLGYVDTWGVEYWYWRWKKFGDESVWSEARAIHSKAESDQREN
jgi:hypothetical protein